MRKVPVGAIVLLLLGAVFYAGMIGGLADYPNTDAAGRGLALAFAGFFGMALWLVLIGLLIRAAVRGTATGWAMLGAIVLLVLSAVASAVAAGLYGSRMGWALAIPALLPPLVALYSFRPRLWLGGVALVLCLVPLVVATIEALPDPARDVQQAAREQAREERLRREERASLKLEAEKFARLGPDSSLGDYLPYLPGGDSRSHEALEGARKVRSRQDDAVKLLNEGRIGALNRLEQLDLTPTPELCQAYGQALTVAASGVTKARPDYLSVAIDLERQLPNIGWLRGAGCDLDQPLGLLVEHVRAVSDSQRMETFANRLSVLKR